jgi:hypothetical protein
VNAIWGARALEVVGKALAGGRPTP